MRIHFHTRWREREKKNPQLGYIAPWHEYARTHNMPAESLLMLLPITRHVMTLIHEYSTLTDLHARRSDASRFTASLR